MYLYLRIQASRNQYFEQIMSPVIATIYHVMIFSSVSFTISNRATRTLNVVIVTTCAEAVLKLNTPSTQSYDLVMSSPSFSFKPAFNMTRWGNIPNLTHSRYDGRKDDKIFDLSTMQLYTVVTIVDSESEPLEFEHDGIHDDWKAKEAMAASIIRLYCSPKVQCIDKGIRTP